MAPSLDRLLTVMETARVLRLSSRTLDRYRATGVGPAYYKLGGRIRYRRSDLMAWVQKNRRTRIREDEDDEKDR